MQVNLDDSTNINIEKVQDKDEYILSVDSRTKMTFSRSEMKYIQAMIDSALKEDLGMSRDSLQKSIKEAVATKKAQLQNCLRNMKIEDIAFAVWYAADQDVAAEILANMSKRSAEDVSNTVRESIERRIRKERAEGNREIESVMTEQGRAAASAMLKKILDA